MTGIPSEAKRGQSVALRRPWQPLHQSAERLPTLTAFDEERIVWMKSLEDDIASEDERRCREGPCKGKKERKEGAIWWRARERCLNSAASKC